MVDLISNRLSEVYGSIRIPNVLGYGEPEERPTAAVLQRFGFQLKRKKIESKEHDKRKREISLYNLKESPSPTVQPELKTLRGLSCRHCAPTDSEQQLDPKERRRDVKDILRITQHAGRQIHSSIFDWGIYLPHLAQNIRLTKFPYPQVSGQVLSDDRLIKAIDQATIESINDKRQEDPEISAIPDDSLEYEKLYEKFKKYHQKRAYNLLIEMRSKISDLLLRITSWVLYKLLPCFMSGVAAHPAQVDMLKAATEKAPNVPLIFLPLHRSHLDYILISFILLNNDIRSPIVAAGSNLRIPFFGALLRGLGAFFIKRKIDPIIGKKDVVYRAVLHTYLQKCLAANHNVEFFIEGGRTRTGKPCMPKSGVLSVIVDAFMDGTINDALLVPVSVNYERLVDGNFIYEQLGQQKQPESFRSAISAIWNTLNSRYGLMRIDFNEPFSMRELVKAFQNNSVKEIHENRRKLQHNPSTTSLYGTDIVQEEHRSLVDGIARHVMYDCASATAVMTTNAVAFLLLTRFRDGVSLSVFIEALDDLRSVLKNERDIGFTGTSLDVINYAIDLLGPGMIVREKRNGKIFIKPQVQVPNVIELTYYSNSLIPHFALDSIVITAISKTLKEQETKTYNKHLPVEKIGVNKYEVMRKCFDHCDVMKYEFIFNKPCQTLESVLEQTLDKLLSRNLISIPELTEEKDTDLVRLRSQVIDEFEEDYLDDDEDEDENGNRTTKPDDERMENDELIYLTLEGHCNRLVLMTVLAPIGHTYLAVAASLNSLLGNCVIEKEFVKICLKEITERVNSGYCKYGESISVDSIRNCLKLLEKWDVIEISSATGMRLVALSNMYNSSCGIENITKRIEQCVPFL